MFQLEFLAHFRTQGRAFAHVSAELFKFKIACFKKSYGCQKIRNFPAFYTRIPERSLFALLSENLARVGGFG